MTIKKIRTAPSGGAPAGGTTPAAPAAPQGGAAIADRLRLDAPDPKALKAGSGKGAKVAFTFALIALGVAGILTYVLWKHWEFLMPA